MDNSEGHVNNAYDYANNQHQGANGSGYYDSSYTYANEYAVTDQNNHTVIGSYNANNSLLANDSYGNPQQDQNSNGDQNLPRELQ